MKRCPVRVKERLNICPLFKRLERMRKREANTYRLATLIIQACACGAISDEEWSDRLMNAASSVYEHKRAFDKRQAIIRGLHNRIE